MRESYFPAIATGSYCVKCRKRIMRERNRRRFKGIYPYKVIKPVSTWEVFFIFGAILLAVTTALVLIGWHE